MSFSPRRPSPAMIVALVALFFSLTGNPFAKGGGSSHAAKPVTGIHVEGVSSGGGTIQPDSTDQGEARCPQGFFVISGGWQYEGSITITTTSSVPSPDAKGWIVRAANPPLGQPGKAFAEAYCGKFLH
jgi:hypothetical protein